MKIVVSILGFGNVGKQICSSLLSLDNELIINIIDISSKIEGAFLDIKHASELFSSVQIDLNNSTLFNQSDFIFHSAGASVPKGMNRLAATLESIRITDSIFKIYVPKENSKIIVISNPVEIITHVVQKITGFPKENVIGTGTFLDSIRMNYYSKVGFKNILSNFFLLGEHGTTVFLSEQLSRVNKYPVNQTFSKSQVHKFVVETKNAAKQIKKTQEATIFGVSYCAIQIFKSFINSEESLLPLSIKMPAQLCDLMQKKSIYLSLPTIINSKGAYFKSDYVPDNHDLEGLNISYLKLINYIPM